MSVTECYIAPPPDPLAALVAGLNVADCGTALWIDPVAADLDGCDYCEPHRPQGVGVATIRWRNRFGRPVGRTCCSLCTSIGLLEAVSDGRDVTIHAAAGGGAR
jgi:hypothetical protein